MSQSTLEQQGWDVVIRPTKERFRFGLGELWKYRDLIALLVRRNFVVNYKQTILGPLWFLIQPLTTTGIYLVIFGAIANIPTDSIPPTLFYMSGVILWSNFAGNVTATSDVFVANSGIFGKIYFPRICVPIASVITNFIALLLQVTVFCCLFVALVLKGSPSPSPYVVFAPIVLVMNAVLALGFGLALSSLTTRYRDLTFALGFGIQLWMYATPVIYPLSLVPEKWRLLMALNPMSTSLEIFRFLTFGTGTVSLAQIVISSAVALTVVVGGAWLFNRSESSAIDTV
jgi:lipopolysaccharide transport system permease protein